ncbi:MAG: hypothetical protein HOQ12_01830 [Gemmatimonadaceae bacterium]|nr:hypothetical protein [Gemmatimonadaceae bacterium]NUQ94985.1 hypothetical protein [Gemmatimonadaceae bacterium]NUR18252.1 hypothetical protein [Gemmatimonadaceae bacterium]
MTQSPEEGRQRSRRRADLGNGLAIGGILVGVFVGITSGSAWLGGGIAVAALLVGIWIGYGW